MSPIDSSPITRDWPTRYLPPICLNIALSREPGWSKGGSLRSRSLGLCVPLYPPSAVGGGDSFPYLHPSRVVLTLLRIMLGSRSSSTLKGPIHNHLDEHSAQQRGKSNITAFVHHGTSEDSTWWLSCKYLDAWSSTALISMSKYTSPLPLSGILLFSHRRLPPQQCLRRSITFGINYWSCWTGSFIDYNVCVIIDFTT